MPKKAIPAAALAVAVVVIGGLFALGTASPARTAAAAKVVKGVQRARVQPDGTFTIRSKAVVAVTHPATGVYYIQFKGNAEGCVYSIALLDFEDGQAWPTPNSDNVGVVIEDENGDPADIAFDLIAAC